MVDTHMDISNSRRPSQEVEHGFRNVTRHSKALIRQQLAGVKDTHMAQARVLRNRVRLEPATALDPDSDSRRVDVGAQALSGVGDDPVDRLAEGLRVLAVGLVGFGES